MKLRYFTVLLFFLALIPLSNASVELSISPSLPIQGDTIDLAVQADPFETVDVTIRLVRELEVISGSYKLKVNDIKIPENPNEFSVKVNDVLTLNVAALGVTISPDVVNKVGSLTVPELTPGKRDVKISGYAAEGETTVTCEITAWTQVTMDENGEYFDSYDLGDIPPGDVDAIVGSISKTITIYPPDNTSPVISNISPSGEITNEDPTISASYSDFFGIKTSSVSIKLDGSDITSESSVTSSGFTYSASSLDNNTNHQVQLTVSDKNSNTASKNWGFSVKLPPIPDTLSPSITNTKPHGLVSSNSVQILASLSDNKRIDTSSVSISINQQDQTNQAQISQSAITTTLSNLQNNTLYTVAVSASDKAGNTKLEEWTFTVQLPSTSSPEQPVTQPNDPPQPKIHAPEYIILGDTLTLDGSQSIDTDGIITQYLWNLGDNTTKVGSTITHTYQTKGKYTIVLMVSDNRGSQISTSHIFNVYSNEDYEINSIPGSSRTVFSGQRVEFDGSHSNSMGGAITQYVWDLVDSVAFGAQTTHIFNSPGDYNVSLLVTDQRWKTDENTIQITVVSPPVTPVKREEQSISNSTIKFTSSDKKSQITVAASGDTSLLLLEYPHNPYPSKPLPSHSQGKVKDISVGNPDSVLWPILVEIKVNSTLDPGVSNRLGLYWFNGSTWVLCEETGYNQTSNTVWAYMTRTETAGSPIIPAVRPSNADIFTTNLVADKNQIEISGSITLSVYLENRGDLPGVFNETLTIGDQTIPIITEIEGHKTSLYHHTYISDTPGNFTASIETFDTLIQINPKPSDLRIENIEITEDSIYQDQVFKMNISISNIGDTTAKDIVVQVLSNYTIFGQKTINRLKNDESTHITFELSFPKPQEYLLKIVLDPLNTVVELNESNNDSTYSVSIQRKPSFMGVALLLVLLLTGFIVYTIKKMNLI